MSGTLYVVATPIGNLGDFSPRALATLREVDFIAAEDTRVTVKLLNHFDIKKPQVSYYQHNLRERGEQIIERILAGESCAICSDAGTPAVSDPGEDLVRLAVQNGIRVVPIPGACAAITALCASGLITGRFCFEGFLPMGKKSRREHLLSVRDEPRTLIFYEAPHKLKTTLADLLAALGDRQLTLARELTKLHEEIVYTTLAAAPSLFDEREPRGEYVLVIAGALKTEKETADPKALLRELSARGYSPATAAKLAAAATGAPKSELYRMLIEEKESE